MLEQDNIVLILALGNCFMVGVAGQPDTIRRYYLHAHAAGRSPVTEETGIGGQDGISFWCLQGRAVGSHIPHPLQPFHLSLQEEEEEEEEDNKYTGYHLLSVSRSQCSMVPLLRTDNDNSNYWTPHTHTHTHTHTQFVKVGYQVITYTSLLPSLLP